jgi:hypothetical protein
MLHHYQIPAPEVMKISGQTNYKTFLRYVNIDREIARSIGARIDAARAAAELETLPVAVSEDVDQASESVN